MIGKQLALLVHSVWRTKQVGSLMKGFAVYSTLNEPRTEAFLTARVIAPGN